MTSPLWTILIPTIGRRGRLFCNLMGSLLPQTEPYAGKVTVLALWNNGEQQIGVLRDWLMEEAKSDYTCFVDDDDELPPYYVGQVFPLLDGVDYIGWRMQMYEDEMPCKPTYHSLSYGGWYQEADRWCRDISHLNPIRRALALDHARFSKPGAWEFEDTNWADQMRGHVSTEHCVPDEYCMYEYLRVTGESAWRGVRPVGAGSYVRPSVTHPNFSWSRRSFL